MSTNDFFLRYNSVRAKTFLKAIKHNKRDLYIDNRAPENIDSSRTCLNYSLFGLDNSVEIERSANSMLALAGISSVRKNAVWAVEVIFSLPINWHSKDTKMFFQDCFEWTLRAFQGVLLCFDIHLDESAPHAHALIFPLIDGRLQGDKLKGGRNKLYERLESFYEAIGQKYGLKLPSKKVVNQKDKDLIAKMVMEQLKGDSIKKSKVFVCIRDSIYKNPLPYAQALGINTSQSDMKTTKNFVDIKRSRGQGEFIR